MRLGPMLAATALAALLAGCGQKPAESSGGQPAAAAPASGPSAEEQQKVLASLPAPYNTADLANGEAKYALCQSCHTLAQGGANMTGPNLHGIFGQKAGEGHEGFKFSDPLKASGIVWTPQNMDPWIMKPTDVVPGTKMTYAGMKDAKDRTDLIAYLMVQTGYKPQ